MNQRHVIRNTELPFPILTAKRTLFKAVYTQIDSEFSSIQDLSVAGKEKWMRMRSLVGEYIGNLYKHIQKCEASYCDLDIVKEDSQVVITLAHDGEPYDQLQKVKSINNSLVVLGASFLKLHGTGVHYGFSITIPFTGVE